MIDITKDIHSVTTFGRNPGQFMKQLKKNKRPMLGTVKGKAEAALKDAESYQRLLDIAARADTREAIRQGFEDVAEGRTRPRVKRSKSFAGDMAYRVEPTNRARRDLGDLYLRIHAEDSPAAARWFNGLRRRSIALRRFPGAAPFAPEGRRPTAASTSPLREQT
jgi:hypothetical protein